MRVGACLPLPAIGSRSFSPNIYIVVLFGVSAGNGALHIVAVWTSTARLLRHTRRISTFLPSLPPHLLLGSRCCVCYDCTPQSIYWTAALGKEPLIIQLLRRGGGAKKIAGLACICWENTHKQMMNVDESKPGRGGYKSVEGVFAGNWALDLPSTPSTPLPCLGKLE